MMNTKLAIRFRTWADALTLKIEHLHRPLTQNPTPKRNHEYQSRCHDARNMERTQKALRVLADGYATSEGVPGGLEIFITRDAIASLVHKSTTGGGGYYSVIEADDYRDTSPAARMLQQMIEGDSSQQAEVKRCRKIEAMEAEIKLASISGYFPTPAPIVGMMLDRARIGAGMRVLEPSAGSGNIADAIKSAEPAAEIHVCEVSYRLRELLTLKGYELIADDFMEADNIRAEYDRVVMNPPFERQADIDHILRAYEFLKPGGVLVAIMAPGFEFRQDRKSTNFREWLADRYRADVEALPDGAFKASGTGVGTRMITIEKPK